MLSVLAPGPLSLVQDLGRPGLAASGVGRSGAADRGALRLGNRLLANPEGAAAIETTLGGLVVGTDVAVEVALTGATGPAGVDGRAVGHHCVVALAAGATLHLGIPTVGMRTYLCVRGGVEVAPVLGSRSHDVLSGLGPAPLAAGDVLPVGACPADQPRTDLAPVAPTGVGPVVLRAVAGPRQEWLDDPPALTRGRWTVSDRSDRVGTRLDGPTLAHRAGRGELPSEGMVRGSLQVPPGGRPVLLGADHPLTGGYPVVAVLLDADADVAAQLRPGDVVGFTLRPADTDL